MRPVISKPPGRMARCSFRLIPPTKKRRGNGSIRKGSTVSSAARTPANTKRVSLKHSTLVCRRSRVGEIGGWSAVCLRPSVLQIAQQGPQIEAVLSQHGNGVGEVYSVLALAWLE